MIAKQTPDAAPMRLPVRLVNRRPSATKRAIPARTAPMVNQSARLARSPRNHVPRSAIQTGAVYWSRIALAAVVILVAVTSVTVQAA